MTDKYVTQNQFIALVIVFIFALGGMVYVDDAQSKRIEESHNAQGRLLAQHRDNISQLFRADTNLNNAITLGDYRIWLSKYSSNETLQMTQDLNISNTDFSCMYGSELWGGGPSAFDSDSFRLTFLNYTTYYSVEFNMRERTMSCMVNLNVIPCRSVCGG